MISHVSVCLLAHEKMLDFKHFLSCKTGVQLFGSSDRLYSRFLIVHSSAGRRQKKKAVVRQTLPMLIYRCGGFE